MTMAITLNDLRALSRARQAARRKYEALARLNMYGVPPDQLAVMDDELKVARDAMDAAFATYHEALREYRAANRPAVVAGLDKVMSTPLHKLGASENGAG